MTTPVRSDPVHGFSWRDVVAGLSVALVLIPQSVAYAELAGMPSHHGLYAAALPPIAAAFFASSPYLQAGPVALTALLTLGALLPLAQAGSAEYVGLAALLALVVGVVRMLVGALKAGWLSYLMSRPMLSGFTSAAAILIVSSQLPGALGSPAPDGSVLGRAVWAIGHPTSWEVASIGLTAVTVLLVLGGRAIHSLVPGVLLAAAGGIVFSSLTGYAGAAVGDIPAGLPRLTLDLPWHRLPVLLLPGAVIALVGFAEAASIARVFASEEQGIPRPGRRQPGSRNRRRLSGRWLFHPQQREPAVGGAEPLEWSGHRLQRAPVPALCGGTRPPSDRGARRDRHCGDFDPLSPTRAAPTVEAFAAASVRGMGDLRFHSASGPAHRTGGPARSGHGYGCAFVAPTPARIGSAARRRHFVP